MDILIAISSVALLIVGLVVGILAAIIVLWLLRLVGSMIISTAYLVIGLIVMFWDIWGSVYDDLSTRYRDWVKRRFE